MPGPNYHAEAGSPCCPGSRKVGRRELLAGAAATAAAWLAGAGPARASGRWWSSLLWGVFENRAFSEVAGLPSHRRLAREGTVLTRYFAVAHPSGPNYRALVSGETWGTAEVVNTFHPSVASAAASRVPPVPTFVYHLAGRIALRHNPFADLHAPVAAVRYGLRALEADLHGGLPESCLVYVGWDDADNLHNGDAARADRNLSRLLDLLEASLWFQTPDREGRFPAFFFCYDEDDGREANRVFATWWGRGVRRAHVSYRRHTHYGFCRTVTENWGLPPLGRAAFEDPMDDVWR